MCARLSALQEADLAEDHHSALAKAFCTVRMRETTGWARELLGGNGILLENHVGRYVADAEAMAGDLALHRARVEARFKDLLRMASGGAPGEDARASAAADPEATTEQRAAALAELGFDQPDASAEELARLASKRGTPFHDGEPLGAVLVTELAAAPDPDQALRHLADLFDRIGPLLSAPASGPGEDGPASPSRSAR